MRTSQSLKSVTAFCSSALVRVSTRSSRTFCRLPSCSPEFLSPAAAIEAASGAPPFDDIVREMLPRADVSAGLFRHTVVFYTLCPLYNIATLMR